MELDEEDVRSYPSQEKVYVRFINSTNRKVEIVWINFSGFYVSYQILGQGLFIDVNTYKRHPWIAIDYKTRDRLHIEKNFVYLPRTTKEYFQERHPNTELPPNFEVRIKLAVTLPLYSLRYASLLAIRDLLINIEDADKLELPKEITDDLKTVIRQRKNAIVQPLLRIQ